MWLTPQINVLEKLCEVIIYYRYCSEHQSDPLLTKIYIFNESFSLNEHTDKNAICRRPSFLEHFSY